MEKIIQKENRLHATHLSSTPINFEKREKKKKTEALENDGEKCMSF